MVAGLNGEGGGAGSETTRSLLRSSIYRFDGWVVVGGDQADRLQVALRLISTEANR